MILREFFYLHKSDRKLLLLLLSIAAICLTAAVLSGREEQEEATSTAPAPPAATAPLHSPRTAYNTSPLPTAPKAERFPFDPNTADSTDLLRLGLQPWQVRNIYKYRAAGGCYQTKEDFARLYGLTVKQYRELEPYIHISPDYLPAATLVSPRETTDTLRYPRKLTAAETIDLGTADTTLLCRVPGIGSYFASRIVQYRERLGGYVNTGQLQEIDGFPKEALDYFTVDTVRTRKLNINKLTLNELKRHPYINYYQAKAITDYRRIHGPIGDLNDLHLLPDFSAEQIGRLRPYITY